MTAPNTAPHAFDAEAVARSFATDAERGLSHQEAVARLALVGPNELRREPPAPRWRRFARQFADPLMILLLGATAISALVWLLEGAHGIAIEAIVILVIMLLNAVLGHVQEGRAAQAVAALRSMTEITATVVREGRVASIDARDLVPGDVMFLEAGDLIAADGRLVSTVSLTTGEAALTGESQPVSKGFYPVPEPPPSEIDPTWSTGAPSSRSVVVPPS